MKYWNKQKHLRIRKWHRVSLPASDTPGSGYSFLGWTSYYKYDTMKRALQLLPSSGKFYMCIMHKDIWFESKEDAVMFVLSGYYGHSI